MMGKKSTPTVMVPVLSLVNSNGRLDSAACAAYARKARATWLDSFLVSGSLGLGAHLSRSERSDLLELWLDAVSASRLFACA